jgi:hypothetical protein
MRGGLHDILAKAEAHAAAKKIEPNALLQARLTSVEVLAYKNTEKSFAEVQALIGRTLIFLDGLSAA